MSAREGGEHAGEGPGDAAGHLPRDGSPHGAGSEASATDAPPEDDLAKALASPDFLASGPGCWGPLQWMTLHQIARGYPRSNPTDAQRKAFVSYATSLAEIMPCSKCAQHWKLIAPTAEHATDSRYTALKWTIDVHNAVNARLHKPVLTYAEAVQAMQDMCPLNTWREKVPVAERGGGRLALTGPSAVTTAQVAATPLYLGTTIALGAAILILIIIVVIMKLGGGSRTRTQGAQGGSVRAGR